MVNYFNNQFYLWLEDNPEWYDVSEDDAYYHWESIREAALDSYKAYLGEE